MNTIRVNTLDLGALLSAFLDALSNASDEELLRHRSKLHSASRKLQELPIIALPPCSDRSEPTPPPSECEDTLLSLSDRLDSPRPSPEDENALPSSGSETDLPPTHREPLPEKNALPALCKRHEPPPTVPSSNCHNSSHSPSDKGKAQRLPSDRHDSSVLPLPNLGADSLPSDTNYGKLLLQLEKKLEEIGKYLERREQDAVAKKQTREEDYRVADMVYFEGNRGSSLAMFLNCLGERSLAKEFDEWETANYAGLSKLMTWIKDPTAFIRNDHTETFLKTIPIIHKEHARRGLQRGIKLLVIESLLETSGISALLAFTPHHLRMLTVGEIHKFTKWLNNERFSNVLELARNKSLWLGNCVRFYSGQTTPPTEISLPTEQREGINPRSNATPPSPTKRTHSFPQPVGKRICRDTAESWPSPTPANGFYQETEDGQGHRSNQGETQNTEGLAALAAAANLSSQAVGHITLQQVDNSQTRDATSPPWIEQYTQDFSHMGQQPCAKTRRCKQHSISEYKFRCS
ncbi:hypothetical protein K432DRAFT_160584 [Lepidopterella palustris CBS 459.81]|uniref:Uncharacterized protein n=1 Tax=Lepidopterella palustris CBS 459.81 TaxID=1314670 RepID=A0A8E2E1Z7_9PEZI|nr:hypothetical protein K432DRAFT_160584 [Lepidopterella palustris CBS 459.81]